MSEIDHNVKDDLELLMARVSEMRTHQRDYFARGMKLDLSMSKQKEREVDELMARLRARGYDGSRFTNKTEQNKLF